MYSTSESIRVYARMCRHCAFVVGIVLLPQALCYFWQALCDCRRHCAIVVSQIRYVKRKFILYPYFLNVKFVCSFVGRYFYNMYINVGNSLKLSFFLISRILIYIHVHILLDLPITYRKLILQRFVDQDAHVYINE